MQFFASYGRVSRRVFWLGSLVIFIGTAVVSLLLLSLGFSNANSVSGEFSYALWVGLNPLGSLIVRILGAVIAVPLGIARRHDRNQDGIDVVIVTLLGMLVDLLDLFGLTGNIGAIAIDIGVPIASIYLLIVLGLLPGNAGTNAYGQSPTVLRAEERARNGSV